MSIYYQDDQVALWVWVMLGASPFMGVALGVILTQVVWNVPWLRKRIIYGQWRGGR